MFFIEPISDYTFGRGVQKNSNGEYRWWFCPEENIIVPDFELSKMGKVVELLPGQALAMLKETPERWGNVFNNYPQVREMMTQHASS